MFVTYNDNPQELGKNLILGNGGGTVMNTEHVKVTLKLGDAFFVVVQSVMPNFLQAHGLKHARLPCLSPSPRTCWNSCPLSQWCHPTISSSVIPVSSCLQSFPASRSFLINQLLTSGGQSIGASPSESVLPMNIQDWFTLGWLVGSSYSPRNSQESSPTPQFKSISPSVLSLLYCLTLISVTTTGKTIALTRQTFVGKVTSLLFHMLSRLVIISFQEVSVF